MKLKNIEQLVILLILVVPWLMGAVLAKGTTSTVFSIVFAPYAWYLVVEKVMILWGWV